MAVVIPERTIDYWLSVEIVAAIEPALLWGPTLNSQGIGASVSDLLSGRPYDLIASIPHVVALEVKSLVLSEPTRSRPTAWGVNLNEDQHWAMLVLESYHPQFAWYVLPAPDIDVVERRRNTFAGIWQVPDLARLRSVDATFGDWMRVIRPSDLTGLLPFTNLYPSSVVPPTELRRTGPKRSKPAAHLVEITDYNSKGLDLSSFLREVNDCNIGPDVATLRKAAEAHDSDDRERHIEGHEHHDAGEWALRTCSPVFAMKIAAPVDQPVP